MKTIFKAVIFLSIISMLLGGCSLSKRITFGKLEAGENFLGSRDGHFRSSLTITVSMLLCFQKHRCFEFPLNMLMWSGVHRYAATTFFWKDIILKGSLRPIILHYVKN